MLNLADSNADTATIVEIASRLTGLQKLQGVEGKNKMIDDEVLWAIATRLPALKQLEMKKTKGAEMLLIRSQPKLEIKVLSMLCYVLDKDRRRAAVR